MTKIKQIKGLTNKLLQLEYDTTVGNSSIAGSDGTYENLKSAIDAGYTNILFVGSTNEPADITLSSVNYHINGNGYTANLQLNHFLGASAPNIYIYNLEIGTFITDSSYIFTGGINYYFTGFSAILTTDVKLINTSIGNNDILFEKSEISFSNYADVIGDDIRCNTRFSGCKLTGGGANCSIIVRSIENCQLNGIFNSTNGVYIHKPALSNSDFANMMANTSGNGSGQIRSGSGGYINVNLPTMNVNVEDNSVFINCKFADITGSGDSNFKLAQSVISNYGITSGNGIAYLTDVNINNSVELLARTFIENSTIEGDLTVISDLNKISGGFINGQISLDGDHNDITSVETIFDITDPATGTENQYDYLNITTGYVGRVNFKHAISFHVHHEKPPHKEGLLFYEDTQKAMSYYNEATEVTVNIGRELLIRVYNGTANPILNGKVVAPIGSFEGVPSISLADARKKSIARLVGLSTMDIPINSFGYVAKFGSVGDINTLLYDPTKLLYLDENNPGELTNDFPTHGSYSIIIGAVAIYGNPGSLIVDILVSDTTVEVNNTNGFASNQRTNTQLAIDDGLLTFTISASSYPFHFYEQGSKYEKESSDSLIFPNTEGRHWFYYELGVLSSIANPTLSQVKDILLNHCLIATTWWNAVAEEHLIDVQDARHGIGMSSETQTYLKLTHGPQWIAGFGLGNINAAGNGDTDSHAQLSVESGVFRTQDLEHTGSTVSVGDTIPIIHYLGYPVTLRTVSETGFAVSNNVGTSTLNYNEWTGSTWQLTGAANGNYVLYHIFAANGVNVNVISIMGRAEYGNISAARDGIPTEVSAILSEFSLRDFIPLGTIVYQTSSTYLNAVNARIREADGGVDYQDWRTSEIAQGANPSSHLNLTNLEAASSGVTWGHINDVAQGIYGSKTFKDTIVFADPIDDTKEVDFDVSSVTTATTRTLIIPDKDGTIALTSSPSYRIENTATTSYLEFGTSGADAFITGHFELLTDNTIFKLEDSNSVAVFDINAQGTIFNNGERAFAFHEAQHNVFIGDGKTTDTLLTGAINNIAIGWFAANGLTGGDYNVFIGYSAGIANTTGIANIAIGQNAGNSSTTLSNWIAIGELSEGIGTDAIAIGQRSQAAINSVSIGRSAGQDATGAGCIAIGYLARTDGGSGINNIGIGYQAGRNNTGTYNVVMGYQAGYSLTFSGDWNIAIGYQAGEDITNGDWNILIGYNAGNAITSGNANIGIGPNTMLGLITGANNVAIGFSNGPLITSIANSIAIGYHAYIRGSRGIAIGEESEANNDCISMGYRASSADQTGLYNITLGYQARRTATLGSYNVVLGFEAGYDVEGDSNVVIGNRAGRYADFTGDNNIVIGNLAADSFTTAEENVFIGKQSGYRLTTGNRNIGLGVETLYNGTANYDNISMGYRSLYLTTGQTKNVSIGYYSGYSSQGSNNIFLGSYSGYYETGSNTFMVTYQQKTNEATHRDGALIYGVMNATTANQTLALNAIVTITYDLITDANLIANSEIQFTDGDVAIYRDPIYDDLVFEDPNAGILTLSELIGGALDKITPITTDYVTIKNDYVIEVDASSGTIEVELLEPNSSNNGRKFELDIYDATNTVNVKAYSNTTFDVNTITDQGGDTWRYTMNGSPDLSNIIIGDKIKVTNSVNAANDGCFVVTAVNDGSNYIEVTNASGVTEAPDTTAEIQETVFIDTGFSTGNIRTYRSYSNRNTYKRIN